MYDDSTSPEFIQLLTSHQPALHAYVITLMRRHADSDDVLQNANVVLWEKRAQFTIGTNFKAWAFKVARFQVMAWQKKQKTRKVQLFDDSLLDLFAQEAPEVFSNIDDRHNALRLCLANLGKPQRNLLLERYRRFVSIKEYAESVGRSAGSLRIALYRTRQALKSCIRQRLAEATQ